MFEYCSESQQKTNVSERGEALEQCSWVTGRGLSAKAETDRHRNVLEIGKSREHRC